MEEQNSVINDKNKHKSIKDLLITKSTKKIYIKNEEEFFNEYEVLQKNQFDESDKYVFDTKFFYPVKRKKDNQLVVLTKDENLRKNLMQADDGSIQILLKYAPNKDSIIYTDSTLYFTLVGDTAVMSQVYTDEDAKALFKDLFTDASRKKASDIHISWEAERVVVKFRIDGKLKPQSTKISHSLGVALKNILVNKAGESEYEENEIAGAITEIIDGIKQEYRLSIGPTHYGNIIVIRLESMIDDDSRLEKWGYSPRAIEMIRNLYHAHHGIVLVTGATGSGKSTLLYTIMIEKKNEDKESSPEILTVEDPVEIPINGINQVQVNTKGDPKNHMTFTRAIKMFLRQDPDMIVVGEIRDSDVAMQAVTSAKTGHLTMSTLHTNDVKSTMTRLNELGIDNANLEDSLKGVISQRLLNSLCSSCKIKEEKNGRISYKRNPDGCLACKKSPIKGYSGRVPAVEIAVLNNMSENYKQENFDDYYSLEENIIWLLEEGIIDEDEAKRFIRIDDKTDLTKRKEFLAIWGKATKEKDESNDIFPVFQNIYDSMEYKLAQEAYIRVRDTNGVLMSPEKIISLTKSTGLYQSLSMFILDRIIENVKRTEFLTFVNIDMDNIEAKGFQEEILEKLNDSGVKDKIVLEFKFSEKLKNFIIFCNENNIKISLDSFSGNIKDLVFIQRNNLKIDYIKTIQDMIEGFVHKEDWVEDYLELLDKQNTKVITNYIETKHIYHSLRDKFKNYIFGYMGFGLHRPIKEEK